MKYLNNWSLFTYSMQSDTGYAPNPFHDICSLNTCKPQIRREANVGDWIVGLKKDRVIFIMEVTKKISMPDYWKLCLTHYPNKIPRQNSNDPTFLCGDCQYDFSGHTPKLLPGFHGQSNIKTDLSGKNTLISENFIYFGSKEKGYQRICSLLQNILMATGSVRPGNLKPTHLIGVYS